jgi:membrane protein required for colicin V production
MNTLDIIILAVLCVMTGYGIWKGLIKQVFSIVGIIAGYVVATRYYVSFAAYLNFSDSNIGKVVAFIILFILCVILFTALAFIVNKFFKLPGLGFINSLFGGVIGFLKGFLIVVVAVIVLTFMLPADNTILGKSVTLPYIHKGMIIAGNMIPRDIKAEYNKKVESIKKGVNPDPLPEPERKKKKK